LSRPAVLDEVRLAELECVRHYFAAGKHLLEVGGADGYQATVLASWGLQVDSIDIAARPKGEMAFPVRDYDGSHMPFADGQFDYVFSSNVLEHIRDLDTAFTEMRRVARPDAIFVHVLPSTAWRFWTNVAHYPYLVRRYLLRSHEPGAMEIAMPGSIRDGVRRRGLSHLIRRALVPAPHGEYKSSVAELYYFSATRWLRTFRQHGFDVVERRATRIFYTGYMLAPQMRMGARRTLAAALGSACNIFVLRRARR